jgi:hypothetical protein
MFGVGSCLLRAEDIRKCDVTFLVFFPPLSFPNGPPAVIWSTNILEEKRFHLIYIRFAAGLSAYQRFKGKM